MRTTSKPVQSVAPTESQAREALGKYIAAHLAIETIDIAAKKQIESIKELAAASSKPSQAELEEAETVMMRYAEAHPEFFKERQKIELYGGHKIGYHISPPAVTLIRAPGEKRKQTWDGFLIAACAIGTWALDLIRNRPEPDKDAILDLWRGTKEEDRPKLASKIARLGVAVTQEERFVVDLNLQPETPTP